MRDGRSYDIAWDNYAKLIVQSEDHYSSIGCGHQIPLRVYISDIVLKSRKILRVTISVGYYLSLTSSEDTLEEYLAREHKLMTPVRGHWIVDRKLIRIKLLITNELHTGLYIYTGHQLGRFETCLVSAQGSSFCPRVKTSSCL